MEHYDLCINSSRLPYSLKLAVSLLPVLSCLFIIRHIEIAGLSYY